MSIDIQLYQCQLYNYVIYDLDELAKSKKLLSKVGWQEYGRAYVYFLWVWVYIRVCTPMHPINQLFYVFFYPSSNRAYESSSSSSSSSSCPHWCEEICTANNVHARTITCRHGRVHARLHEHLSASIYTLIRIDKCTSARARVHACFHVPTDERPNVNLARTLCLMFPSLKEPTAARFWEHMILLKLTLILVDRYNLYRV